MCPTYRGLDLSLRCVSFIGLPRYELRSAAPLEAEVSPQVCNGDQSSLSATARAKAVAPVEGDWLLDAVAGNS